MLINIKTSHKYIFETVKCKIEESEINLILLIFIRVKKENHHVWKIQHIWIPVNSSTTFVSGKIEIWIKLENIIKIEKK